MTFDKPLTAYWSPECDVFSYGVVLLNLISKRIITEEDRENETPYVYEWADEEYETHLTSAGSSEFSLAHPSLEADVGFESTDAHKVTELAMQCVQPERYSRPTMKQVVKRLLELRVVSHHAHELGIKKRARASN